MEYEFERNEEDNLAIWFNPKNFFTGFEEWSQEDDVYGLEIEFDWTDDEDMPTESQLSAFKFLLENTKSIFESLLTYMNKDKEVWVDIFYLHDGEYESGFPNCKTHHELHKYFSINKISIKKGEEENISHIGLTGGCEWDTEHGFGAILHKQKVKEVGSWDTGYSSLSASLVDKEFSMAESFGLEPLEKRRKRIKKESEKIHIDDATAYLDLFQWLIDQKVIYGYRCTEPDLNDKEIVALILDTTYLDFTSKNLMELPESFSLLENLTGLTLRHNKFTTFPVVLAKLPKIKNIGISYNSITEIPADFSFQNPIKSLDLSGNQLKNIDPLITHQKQLHSLDAANNQLTSISEAYAGLTSLNDLRLASNNISSVHECIGDLIALKTLLMRENKIVALPETFTKLSNLTYLKLSDNQLTELPKPISQLKSLEHLDVSNNRMKELPEWIVDLPQLEELDLSQNKLSSLPKKINEVQTSLDISIWGNAFTRQELEGILTWIDPEIGSCVEHALEDLEKVEAKLKRESEG